MFLPNINDRAKKKEGKKGVIANGLLEEVVWVRRDGAKEEYVHKECHVLTK